MNENVKYSKYSLKWRLYKIKKHEMMAKCTQEEYCTSKDKHQLSHSKVAFFLIVSKLVHKIFDFVIWCRPDYGSRKNSTRCISNRILFIKTISDLTGTNDFGFKLFCQELDPTKIRIT